MNLTGKKIKTLINKNLQTGEYSIEFNASRLNNGIYFYTIETLPAHIRLTIVGFHALFIQHHKVIWTNVHAGCFVPAFATVTFFIYYKTWH